MRFILLSFFFLGWAFYEASGGSDFAREMEQKRAEPQLQPPETKLSPDRPPSAVMLAPPPNQDAPEPTVPDAMVTRVTFGEKAVSKATDETTPNSIPDGTPALKVRDLPAATVPPTTEAQTPTDMRAIRASRANVRNGPGTGYNVVFKLERGTIIEILQNPGNGWVKLRTQDGDRIGWVAASLLKKVGN